MWPQAADLTVEVPLTKAVFTSPTILRWVEMIGERSTVLGINGIVTASPCLNKRVITGQTLDYSLVSYDSATKQYTVLPTRLRAQPTPTLPQAALPLSSKQSSLTTLHCGVNPPIPLRPLLTTHGGGGAIAD